jgi:splicing factor 3B subunit 4
MALHLDKNQEATVWVGGLDLEVDEDLLWELCFNAGPVVSVNMPRDKITGDHAGYAFVEFSSEQDADYAMKIMNMVRLYGKAIKINKAARDRKEMDVGANIFVGNLEEEVDDQLLYNAFSVFGQVLAAKVMYDTEGKHRGFGFVNFADFDSADMAIQHMSGQFLCNRAIHVSYAYKEGRKGERHGSYEGYNYLS